MKLDGKGSKDPKKVVCGGTDAELERKFYNREVLVENLDEIKKKDMHKVDMSTVMMKLSAVGKRMEKVPESPDPSPSKVPSWQRTCFQVKSNVSPFKTGPSKPL